MPQTAADTPLQPLISKWTEAIRAAWEFKQQRFGADAEEGQRFFASTYDFFWNQMAADRHFRAADDKARFPEPAVKIQINKVAEFVQLFGPAIYSRNPVRTVSPNEYPPLPAELYAQLGGPDAQPAFMAAQQADVLQRRVSGCRAGLMQTWLNYTPAATDLRTHARRSVVEALIKGMGLLYPQVVQPPGSPTKLTGCRHDSVDNLVIDPDADSLATARWVARRVVEPAWQAERRFQLDPGSLADVSQHGTDEATGAPLAADTLNKRSGKAVPQVVYWEVWSKMGAGGRLTRVDTELGRALESLGDFCKVVVCEGVPYPLNCPPAMTSAPDCLDQVRNAVLWDTPFFADGGWPFVPLYFHDVPGNPWPLSHLAPAMGELKFLNWAFGMLASKVRVTSRDFIVVKEGASESIKDKILNGGDLELLSIKTQHGDTIEQVIQFLKHPEMNGDIWKVINAVMDLFDKRTGLTELVYGETGTQMRSGTEAKIKGDQMNIRPDDMAEAIEDAMGKAGRMEALVARWHLQPTDVAPVMGQSGSEWWGKLVYAADVSQVVYNLQYRVEAGTARKPNKARDMDQATALINQLFPPLFQFAQATGQMGPVNSVLEFWCKANDIADAQRFLLNAPPPPPAVTAGPGGGPPPGGPPGANNAARAASP